MQNAAKQIIESLEKVFAPMDADVLANTQKWAVGRVEALREFKAGDEYQALRRDAFKLYPRLFAIAGGKTWYGVFNGNTPEKIAEFVEKNCAATVESRNAAITRKLLKAGVTEVVSEEYTTTSDGFDGLFIVNTDAGKKRVTVRTIRAGGYNVQCAHLRVLVNVK